MARADCERNTDTGLNQFVLIEQTKSSVGIGDSRLHCERLLYRDQRNRPI